MAALAEALKRLLAKTKTKVREAAVAVAGSAVITKIIDMPADLSDLGLENQIMTEADQYVPYPLDEVALDYEVLGPSATNPDQIEILLAACRHENVDTRVSALEAAGLRPRVVDVEVFAIERAFRLIGEQFEDIGDHIVAIADIGATVLTLNVLVDGKTLYTREQLFGAPGHRGDSTALRVVDGRSRAGQEAGWSAGRLRDRDSGTLQGGVVAADSAIAAVLLLIEPVQLRRSVGAGGRGSGDAGLGP